MAKRKGLSKRTRFEIFKRDSFQCQYCGQSAPDAVLEIEHIVPVASGGGNDVLNLVTACKDCNSGKSNIHLTDETVALRQRKQAAELAEKKSQMEMLLQWRTSLLNIEEDTVSRVEEYWGSITQSHFSDYGRTVMRKCIKKFGLRETLDAIQIACDQYSDTEVAFQKIGAIAHVRKKSKDDPAYELLCMVRGVLKKRSFYIDHAELERLIREAVQLRLDTFEVTALARNERNWTAFINALDSMVYSAINQLEKDHLEGL